MGQVVLVLGLSQSQEAEQNDRVNITLPEAQLQLYSAVRSVARKLVVVLVHGGAIAMSEVYSSADAVLDAHYPGPNGGTAVAKALFGRINPSGHLPYR